VHTTSSYCLCLPSSGRNISHHHPIIFPERRSHTETLMYYSYDSMGYLPLARIVWGREVWGQVTEEVERLGCYRHTDTATFSYNEISKGLEKKEAGSDGDTHLRPASLTISGMFRSKLRGKAT
jgi:hypothetical protein